MSRQLGKGDPQCDRPGHLYVFVKTILHPFPQFLPYSSTIFLPNFMGSVYLKPTVVTVMG